MAFVSEPMLLRLIIVVTLLWLSAPAVYARSPEGIFEGELGDKRIVVEFFSFDQGHFFVAGIGDDNWFAMEGSGDSLTLMEGILGVDRKLNATWRLQRSSDGWVGERQETRSATPERVTLRTVLHRAEYPDVPFSRDGRPYQFRRIESISRFERLDSPALKADRGYELVTERRTGIIRPRLTRLANHDLLTAVNRILEDQHYTAAWEAWLCGQQQRHAARQRGAPIPTRVPYEQTDVQVTYLSSTLMSYVATVRRSCDAFGDGLHVNAFNLDLTTAKRLAIFLPWPRMPPGMNPYNGEFLNLGGTDLAESFDRLWLGRLRAAVRRYLASPERNRETDSCADAILDNSFLLDSSLRGRSYGNLIYFTVDGLAVHVTHGRPPLPDVCVVNFSPNPVTIPFSELEPFLIPEHPFTELRR